MCVSRCFTSLFEIRFLKFKTLFLPDIVFFGESLPERFVRNADKVGIEICGGGAYPSYKGHMVPYAGHWGMWAAHHNGDFTQGSPLCFSDRQVRVELKNKIVALLHSQYILQADWIPVPSKENKKLLNSQILSKHSGLLKIQIKIQWALAWL